VVAAEAQQPVAAPHRDHRPPTPCRPCGRGTGIASAPNRLPSKPVTPHRARPLPRSPEPPPKGPPDRPTRANSRQGQPSEGRPLSRRQGQGEPAAEILHLATAGGAESSDPHRPLHRRRGLSPAASLGAAERRGRRRGGWRWRDLGFASSVASRGRREESETVFHISQLKARVGKHAVPLPHVPLVTPDGKIKTAPFACLDERLIHRKKIPVKEWLIHWESLGPEDATWEDMRFIETSFPEFQP
jgi:hypothetical protein